MDQSMVARFKKAAERQNEILSGGNIFEQAEKKKQREYDALDKKWAEEKKMDFLLQRDRQAQESDLAKQGLVNAGQLANTETVNTGAMARQRLMEDTKRAENLNDYNRGIFNTQADIFKTQVLGNAKQPDNTLRGKEMEVAASILNNSTTDPNSPQAKWAMGILNSWQQSAQTANPAAQPEKKQFVPSTSFDNNKDTAIPQQSKGAQSMTFDTNMGTAGKSPEQFRAETEDLYYRLNPQLKKKRDATLFGS